MIYSEDEYEALEYKASIETSYGLGEDYEENVPTMFYVTYQMNSFRQYYPASISVAIIEKEEMSLNAGRFVRYDRNLCDNVVLSEVCPDGYGLIDWSHYARFKERIQWCFEHVTGKETWSLFVQEGEPENHFAFAFSDIETAMLFKLSVL